MPLGKEDGKKTTLRELLETDLGALTTEFKALSHDERDMLFSNYQAKKDKEHVPKKASRAAVLKAIYSQMDVVSAIVSVCTTFSTYF